MTAYRYTALAMLVSSIAFASIHPTIMAQLAESSTQRADAVASRLNCPICEGYTLRDCPLPICAQMREEIKQMVEEGRSDEEIMGHFVDLHGPQVLNMPPARGAFLMAWILPIAVIAGGAFAVARSLFGTRRTRTSKGERSDAELNGAPDAETLARLERLLEEREAR